MDAITLLKQDHAAVKELFRRYEKLGDRAYASKRRVVDDIVRELSIHAAIEEVVFYPAVKELSDELRDHVLESLEEHHVVKWLCDELEHLGADADRFDAKTKVLIESVRHHIGEEEGEFFPEVREALGRKTLGEIGRLLEEAKRIAPRHPHPKAPDEPPFNGVAAGVAALVDRVRDTGSAMLTRRRARASSH